MGSEGKYFHNKVSCHETLTFNRKLHLFGGNWIGLKKSKQLVLGSKYESNGKSKKNMSQDFF